MNHFYKPKYSSPIWRLRQIQKTISIFLLGLFITFLVGCAHYYEVNTTYDPLQVEGLQYANDYIILHHAGIAWHLTDITINKETQELDGNLSMVDGNHRFYQRPQKPKRNRYYSAKHEDPTYESHIYASEIKKDETNVVIALSAIQRIDIYDKDVGATTSSYVLGGIASIAGVVGVLALIVALTKSSCPFVYVNDGTAYRFVGEMYGGAIYASLEREDFMPLPNFHPVESTYDIKIANKLLERQYTNLAELILVQHPTGTEVNIDKYGEVLTIIDPVLPIKAVNSDGSEITDLLMEKDSMSYLFQDGMENIKEMSSAILTFPKPQNTQSGKLVLNAKNSFWLDYLFGEFTKKFGTNLDDFIVKQRTSSSEKPIQWQLDQGIPLSVQLKTNEGWKAIDHFYVVGPLASRDLVMDIDLSDVNADSIQLKLESGYMFWELDYAAIDYSEPIPVDIAYIAPNSAIDETGKDVLNEISVIDESYLYQPEVGNVAVIKYPAPNFLENQSQSVFLHSQGYYEYIRDYQNKPEYAALRSFRKKGSLTAFSKSHYQEFMNNVFSQQNTVER